MKRMLIVLSVLLLSGCASYGSYRYVDRTDRAGDYYYDRSYAGYGYGYYGSTWYGYPYDVAYRHYPYYYSLFWGFRPYYYDPFFSPGFYYGVTWFPRTWFSFSLGYHDWGYYHAYAPWRYSFWGNYYTWYHAPRRGRPGHFPGVDTSRFGSARNEAERLASLNSQARRGVRTALPSDKSRDVLLGARHPGAAGPTRTTRVPTLAERRAAASAGRVPAERAATDSVRRGEPSSRSSRDEVRRRAPSPPPRPSARVEHPQVRGESTGTWRASPRGGGPEVWRHAATPSQRIEPGSHVSGRPVPAPDRRVVRPVRAPDTAIIGRQSVIVGERVPAPSAEFQRPLTPQAAPAQRVVPNLPAHAAPTYGSAPAAPMSAPAPAPPHSAPPARTGPSSDSSATGTRGGRSIRQDDR